VQAQVALLLDGMAVFDRTIKVSMARGGAGPGVVRSNDPDRVQRTVHVGGLPMEELSETVLADFFQNVGEVTSLSSACMLGGFACSLQHIVAAKMHLSLHRCWLSGKVDALHGLSSPQYRLLTKH